MFTQFCDEASHRFGLDRHFDLDLSSDAGHVTFRDPWIADEERHAIVGDLHANHQSYVKQIVDDANAICRYEFPVFGFIARYGETIDWQADPVSGRKWPNEFHTRIRIFDGDAGDGDVKYVWEMNRHQFLPLLGKAYRLTNDERYARAGLDLIDSWIEGNPYGVGINWTSALEVAVRSLSWCWACALFEGSESLTPARRRHILISLSQHARYIERHLSSYFTPYNHLVGEATALFVIGSLVPSLRRAVEWRDRGWAILEAELPKQYHPDGGSIGQATGYHHFTLGFHLHAMLVKRRVDGPIGSRLWTDMEKAIEFSMEMMRPDGSMPMIGDADEGKAFSLVRADLWDFRVFLAIGAALFGRGDFKKLGGSLPSDASWIIGMSGRRTHDAVQEALPEHTSAALRSSGYYIMRTGWDRQAHSLTFNCGELAAGVSPSDAVSAAHGHADTLSVEVSSFGQPVVVDPGFWTCKGDHEWHRYFRETEAHNTVVVDGQSQAAFCGRLEWPHAPKAEAHEWITLAAFDYAQGSHTGYRRLASPVTHRRTALFLKPYYWIVRDELTGGGEHSLDRCFHFATPDVVRDSASGAAQTRWCDGRPNVAVVPVERSGVTLELARGGPVSAGGWLAIGYERKLHAAMAKFRSKAELPCSLHTVLLPFRGESTWVRVAIRPIHTDEESPRDRAFEVFRPDGRDLWAFSTGPTARFHDRWFSDGRATCIQLGDAGQVKGCILVGGSRIELNGEPILALDRRVRAATLKMVNGRPVVETSEPATVTNSIGDCNVRKAG
jgi:hypothetical protein